MACGMCLSLSHLPHLIPGHRLQGIKAVDVTVKERGPAGQIVGWMATWRANTHSEQTLRATSLLVLGIASSLTERRTHADASAILATRLCNG